MKTRALSRGLGRRGFKAWEGQKKYTSSRRIPQKTTIKKIRAAKDGRNLGLVAKKRLTPAHATLEAVYAGLIDHYNMSGSTLFKEAFHRANAGGRV